MSNNFEETSFLWSLPVVGAFFILLAGAIMLFASLEPIDPKDNRHGKPNPIQDLEVVNPADHQ